ncbi:hypothetical protein [Spongiactinospora sp. TRM90649]|nr:hypothetical protein [Spongiactinospora sp. TRM90649]MDF5755390.1 hypothetical protein [Spongiactinospora sp. TRM90649]
MIDHERSADCACGPGGDVIGARTLPQPLGVIYRHHSLQPCADWEAAEHV